VRAGLAWGEAKARTTAVLEGHIAPMRDRYEALIARPDELEDILLHGARKARAVAMPFLHALRDAVGLGRLVDQGGAPASRASHAGASADKLASFKQYREGDGRFYFKLTASDGAVLLQSQGFEGGRDAGQWVKRIRSEGLSAAQAAPVALGPGVDWAQVQAALQALQAQDAQA
ncbi:MAG: tryptophan--tRNA ligase, partial [Betaproteobacteria bacterium]